MRIGGAILGAWGSMTEGLMEMAQAGGGAGKPIQDALERVRGAYGDLAGPSSDAVVDSWRNLQREGGQLAADGASLTRIFGRGREGAAAALDFMRESAEALGPVFHTMREQIVKFVDIIPIEFIIRNIATGSLTKRLGIEEGTVLDSPLIEYCLKDDKLGDPIISREHIINFKWLNIVELDLINKQCLRINDFLQGMFRGVGIKLIDFKVEFGKTSTDEIILADEISPDTCRLWDIKSERKLDKDRFRKDLGNIIQAYQEVARRLGIVPETTNISEVNFKKPTSISIKKK